MKARGTIVLLPGLDGTGLMFQPFVQHLPEGWNAIVVDYPGREPSSYCDLLEIVKDAIPQDRPYVVLGESFSGPLAVRLAAEKPAGLRGVILCATFVRSPTPWYARFPSVYTPLIVHSLAKIESWCTKMLFGVRDPRVSRLARQARRVVDPHVMASRVRQTMLTDVTAELSQIDVPLLYLAAEWDLVVPPRCVRLIQKLRPDLEVRRVRGPHGILQSRPQASWEALSDWLEERFPQSPAPTAVMRSA